MENLINIIFPPSCKFCKKFGFVFCPNCLAKTHLLDQQFCVVCGQESFSGFTHEKCLTKETPYRLFSLLNYEGIVRDAIKNSKYGLYEFSILKKLTDYAMTKSINEMENMKETILVPVPVSKFKLEKRGFNHAEIIAQVIAKKLTKTKVINLLKRTRDTVTQHALDRKERFENIKDAFRVCYGAEKIIAGKDVTLIDDIITTGATLLECSKVLYQAGARTVSCCTLSRKHLEK